MKVEELLGRDVFEYDKDLFVSAVNEAYSNWQGNNNYNKRIEMQGSPRNISSISDMYKIPNIDMVEFKELSDKVGPNHPLSTNSEIDPKYSIYSSGTTKGDQSIVPRSKRGVEIHRKSFQKFVPSMIPHIDSMYIIAPDEKYMDKMPINQKNRAVMKYVKWCFIEPFDSKCFVELKEGSMIPQFSKLEESLNKEPKDKGLFGLPLYVDSFIDYLDNKKSNVSLGEEGIVATAGGWKGMKERSKEDFRKRMKEFLGIKDVNHVDLYGFSESMIPTGNKAGDKNPDHKRVPSQGLVYVADEDKFMDEGEIKEVPNGKKGLAVFVDPLNPDHPGAILTDDIITKTGGDYGKDVRIEYIGRSTQ